ncbi:MAG: glycosyltransferase family 4 protein [Desulfobacterales bacterium]|nr:glycosyltransferase family 4 protein [Desulfobacterales bacterium]
MNILIVMLYWYPYEGPLMPIYGAIFKDLMGEGRKVTIVTSFPHYRKGRPETWDEYRGKLFEKTAWEGATLIRSYVFAPVFKNTKFALFYRALNFISFNISCIIAGIFMTGKKDLIFAPSSPPLTNGICAHIIGCFKKIPFIYNVQDVYPDMAVKLGILNNKGIIRILRVVEDFVYKKAKRVLVISEAMKRNLLKKTVEEDKIKIISNFIDTDSIKPMAKENEFSLNFGLNSKFVVMYAGNIGLPHGLEFVVEAAEILAKHKNIVFAFVSRGEYKDEMMGLCKSKGLKNVVFSPQQPEYSVPQIWASADVSLVTSRKGLSTDSVPSKTFAIMASGRPIIAMIDEGSEVWNLVEKAQCGICVVPERPDLLADAILRLCSGEADRKDMGENGRRFVVKNFSRSVTSQKYEELLLNVLNE